MTELSIHDPALGESNRKRDRTDDRIRAYKLFLNSTLTGDRRSLRSIAQELGVNISQISFWKSQDKWVSRVDEALEATTALAESTSQVIKRLVRRGLISGLKEIERIITADLKQNTKVTADDKIKALRALAEISIKLDAIAQGAGPGASGSSTKPMGFKDDLTDGLQLDDSATQPVGSQKLGDQPDSKVGNGRDSGGKHESDPVSDTGNGK
jgi:transposase-like protein